MLKTIAARHILASVAILLSGCALRTGPQAITKSLPADQLAYFCDAFDTIRSDVWEKAGYVFNPEQLRNLKPAEVRIENGRLHIETQPGGFSKGGLVSQFTLKGDFDVQVDGWIEWLDGDLDMDQMLGFGIVEQGQTLQENRLHTVVIGKKGGDGNSFLFAGYHQNGKYRSSAFERTANPAGAFRFVRISNRLDTYYKEPKQKEWRRLSSLPAQGSAAVVGFTASNFFKDRSSIGATRGFEAWFDNFIVNAAQEIVEGEI